MDVEALKESFIHNLEFALAKDEFSATARDLLNSLALTVRDRLIERWLVTQQTYYRQKSKRVYYLSLEFLIGRMLGNALINLGLERSAEDAMASSVTGLENLAVTRARRGPGQRRPRPPGGLLPGFHGHPAHSRRTATASATSTGSSSRGSGDGEQIETPDNWLRHGNPWEVERPEHLYPVQFYGRVEEIQDAGREDRLRLGGHADGHGHGLRHARARVPQQHGQQHAPLVREEHAGVRPGLLQPRRLREGGRGEGQVRDHLQGAVPERQRVRGQGAAPEAGVLLRGRDPAGHHPPLQEERRAGLQRLPRPGGRPAQRHPPLRGHPRADADPPGHGEDRAGRRRGTSP